MREENMSENNKTYRKLQVVRPSKNLDEALEIVSLPLVDPIGSQIRLKVLYTGINITDVNLAAGRFFVSGDLPYDIGFESIAAVDKLGPEAGDKFKLGDSVIVADPERYDAFSEYQYKEAKYLVPIPDSNPEYLVAYGSGLTATIGLDVAGRIKAGETVLITSAAGGTGQIALQWAKHHGAHVIGLTSTDEKVEYLKQIGADFVINYKSQDVDKVLKEHYPAGVDVIWETVGGDSLKTLFYNLAQKGRLIVAGSSSSYVEQGWDTVELPDWNSILMQGSKSLVGFVLFDHVPLFEEYFKKLITMIQSKQIKCQTDFGPKEASFVGLDSISRAEKYLQNRQNIGKVIVRLE